MNTNQRFDPTTHYAIEETHPDADTSITPAAPPFFLQHGTMDDTVPVQMSINFAAELEQAIGKDRVRLELLEGAGHGDPRFEAPDNVSKVLDFLDKYVK